MKAPAFSDKYFLAWISTSIEARLRTQGKNVELLEPRNLSFRLKSDSGVTQTEQANTEPPVQDTIPSLLPFTNKTSGTIEILEYKYKVFKSNC